MKSSRIIARVMLLIAPLFLTTGCGRKEEVPPAKAAAVVSIETVKEYCPAKDLETRYSAVVEPTRQVDVAFKASGYVESIRKVRAAGGLMRILQPGDFVPQGTVLARVKQTDYVARVNEQVAAVNEIRMSQRRAEAALAEAETALEAARINYERTSRLFAADSATKPEFDSAKSNFELSETRVKEAQTAIEANKATQQRGAAGVAEANLALQDTAIRAPFDGIIVKRYIEEGSLAAQGTPAFAMADARTARVAFGVPDVELASLKLAQDVTVSVEAVPGKTFPGQITEISPAADPRSRVFNVEVSLPNTGRQLRLGMVASLVLPHGGANKSSLTIPLSAIVRSTQNPDGYAVFVIQEQSGKYFAQERQVELGEAFGHLIAVVNGVKAGDRIVTNGSTRIAGGQEVKPADQEM